MVTEQAYKEAIEQKESAQEVIDKYHTQKRDAFDARINSGKPFIDDELIYSAFTLCPCGHGVAYPKNCGPGHYWDCSAILKGIADKGVTHTGKLPFAFYEVKSENQPSANGNTTRGVYKPKYDTR